MQSTNRIEAYQAARTTDERTNGIDRTGKDLQDSFRNRSFAPDLQWVN